MAPKPPANRRAEDPLARSAEEAGRLAVLRTPKLYLGGAFPRTESGRTYPVTASDGTTTLANACQASRKDVREAVRAARAAQPGWENRTAMNRGQILYRVAEIIEGRRAQLAEEVAAAEGVRADRARDIVGRAVDRWVWYAGWADKISAVLGTVNPVAAPFFDFTIPEPTGVVGIVAPQASSFLGLVSRLAPVLVGGNTAVVVASEARPIPAVTLGEVLATSDVPGGVVNILTGLTAELAPVLAAHQDVDALDSWGVADADQRAIDEAATENVKRVGRRPHGMLDAKFDWLDDRAAQRLEWISVFLEAKTIWHPVGT
jgi:acyl-CoA reductase-like NAD-dependent aldehyde dehydrogenase